MPSRWLGRPHKQKGSPDASADEALEASAAKAHVALRRAGRPGWNPSCDEPIGAVFLLPVRRVLSHQYQKLHETISDETQHHTCPDERKFFFIKKKKRRAQTLGLPV